MVASSRKDGEVTVREDQDGGFRDEDTQAYQSGEGWMLRYSDSKTRREISEARGEKYKGPPMKIFVAGKPSSGKGTISPMISRAYRGVYVSSGNLLRSEVQAETDLGKIAHEQMTNGEMLPSQLVMSLIKRRMHRRDCMQNGWILDGFPRAADQASLLKKNGLTPDCIVVLERPDELVREFSLGRFTDSLTGMIYHPKFAPPPPEVRHRLVWRTDDTRDVIDKRLNQYNQSIGGMLEKYPEVPQKVFDTSRSDLDTFEAVCDFIEEVAVEKAKHMGPNWREALNNMGDARLSDVEEISKEDTEKGREEKPTLLVAARRCNRFDMRDYLPVFVNTTKVGFASKTFARELVPFFGSSVEMVFDMPGAGADGSDGEALVLAPYSSGTEQATRELKRLVEGLVGTGAIPSQALRNELQDVHGISSNLNPRMPPLVKLERAAMIYFGVPSFGVHVNGYVRDNGRIYVWLGVRSNSKATYPGLWDQMVAGGQPAGMSFMENVQKECEEEASISTILLNRKISQSGMIVSYRYSTRKGLSTKYLCVFDLELPSDFTPYNGDGEVEEFMYMTVEDALESIENNLQVWKPNCALVMIDFALRHGYINPDEEDYLELVHQLRTGLCSP
ncbi:unnamed protein product [Discosporangium mesarthrocarpum]